ncbi:MAG: fatty acid desaturase [Planctomycetes bacterium]|nr:fatty acid desaturase [Planctomycetota bacterium]
MSTAGLTAPSVKSLNDPALIAHLHRLRQTDDLTNWYYLLRTYLYLVIVIGGTVWFCEYQAASGLSIWWDVPMILVAIGLVGAGQHQLSGLAHEGSHHILFRGRYLNELASDWLCMFPLFSTTHHYRLQHHAHHQFVNDPQRDPDVSQLQTSGHWLPFPMPKKAFLLTLLKQLWVPNLIRFMRVRAQYNAVGTDKNPYLRKGWKPSKAPVLVGAGYLAGLILLLGGLVMLGNSLLLALVPAASLVPALLYFYFLPEAKFHQSRVRPVVHQRWMSMGRIVYASALFNALAWVTFLTGRPAPLYFFLLWLVPLFTSFSFFMILRQLVQHGNGDRGWLTNTRVFLVNRFINYAVFPMGQDYHLPHHLYASVPHYRLRELHEVLMEYPEYREKAVVVEGYFVPRHRPPTAPTVLDVLGPAYAPREFHGVHIDNSVLEGEEVEDREAILREGKQEAERLQELARSASEEPTSPKSPLL